MLGLRPVPAESYHKPPLQERLVRFPRFRGSRGGDECGMTVRPAAQLVLTVALPGDSLMAGLTRMMPLPPPHLPQLLDREVFDGCIIGSGAAGGIAAKELTERGPRVAGLERGDWVSAPRLRNAGPPLHSPLP